MTTAEILDRLEPMLTILHGAPARADVVETAVPGSRAPGTVGVATK